MNDLMNERDAAKTLGIGKHTMAAWRKRYGIAHYKIGGRIHYKRGDLDNFIESLRVTPKPAAKAKK